MGKRDREVTGICRTDTLSLSLEENWRQNLGWVLGL